MKKGKTQIIALITALVLCSGSASATQLEPSHTYESDRITHVLEKMEYLRGFKDSAFNFMAEVVSVDGGKVGKRHLLDVKISDEGYALIEVLSPRSQRGQRMLVRNGDIWLYLPRTSNVIRIAPLQRVFGAASIADLLNVSYLHGYTLENSIILDGGHLLNLDLKSKNRTATFARINFDFDLDAGVPTQSRHFTASNRLLKTIEYKAFQDFDGEQKVAKIVIHDALRTNSAIWIRMSNYRKATYPDAMFTKMALSR